MDKFKPLIMSCTLEQYLDIKPDLLKLCCKIEVIEKDFTNVHSTLTNNYCGVELNIANLEINPSNEDDQFHIDSYNRTYVSKWDRERFLKSLGV